MELSPIPPSAWIERWAAQVPAGQPVLDVAAGGGRHVALMRSRGHPVTAIDRDVSALVARFGAAPDLRIIEADLENGRPWPLPGETFGGVIVTNYLHRPLFPALLAALEPGGVLLYATFMAGHERHGRPCNPDFLLRPGELLEVARSGGLTVLAYEAGPVEEPRPAVVQRIAARRVWTQSL
jgi:SAM-dependent methyltransferase